MGGKHQTWWDAKALGPAGRQARHTSNPGRRGEEGGKHGIVSRCRSLTSKFRKKFLVSHGARAHRRLHGKLGQHLLVRGAAVRRSSTRIVAATSLLQVSQVPRFELRSHRNCWRVSLLLLRRWSGSRWHSSLQVLLLVVPVDLRLELAGLLRPALLELAAVPRVCGEQLHVAGGVKAWGDRVRVGGEPVRLKHPIVLCTAWSWTLRCCGCRGSRRL